MIKWFKGLQHPEAFHGTDSRSPYFEGWYHKLVSKTKRSIVIIPGMYRSGEVENEFSFIMVFEKTHSYALLELSSLKSIFLPVLASIYPEIESNIKLLILHSFVSVISI